MTCGTSQANIRGVSPYRQTVAHCASISETHAPPGTLPGHTPPGRRSSRPVRRTGSRQNLTGQRHRRRAARRTDGREQPDVYTHPRIPGTPSIGPLRPLPPDRRPTRRYRTQRLLRRPHCHCDRMGRSVGRRSSVGPARCPLVAPPPGGPPRNSHSQRPCCTASAGRASLPALRKSPH